jgi:hypothetical protein
MKTRNHLEHIRRFLLSGGVSVALIFGLTLGAMGAGLDSGSQEGAFDRISKNGRSAIPLIDTNVPSHYETASFGLG